LIVRDLLDYDPEATVEILVDSKEDSFDTNDFKIEENKFSSRSYLTLKVIPDGHVVVDEAEYEDLKQGKLESDDLVEQMTSTMEGMQEKIDELERGE